jgi:hypothetical protein
MVKRESLLRTAQTNPRMESPWPFDSLVCFGHVFIPDWPALGHALIPEPIAVAK